MVVVVAAEKEPSIEKEASPEIVETIETSAEDATPVAPVSDEEEEMADVEPEVVAAPIELPQPLPETTKEVVTVDENKNEAPSTGEKPVESVVAAPVDTPQVPKLISKSRSLDKMLITYEANQWSPDNPEGAKKYSIAQLRELNKSDLVKKPTLPTNVASLFRANNSFRNNLNLSMPAAGLMPRFANGGYGGGGGGMHTYTKTRSQQGHGKNMSMERGQGGQGGGGGQGGMGGGNRNGSRGGIPASRQSFVNVKLHEAENPWVPKCLVLDDKLSAKERDNLALYKTFRSTLNKLAPENFAKLVEKLKSLQIDTEERMIECIRLVFEKAIDEPHFASTYALACEQMSHMKIAEETGKRVTFKIVLLNRCQEEFEKNKDARGGHEARYKEMSERIAAETNPDKKAELSAEWADETQKYRRRATGTVKFIGELYKREQLNDKIMHSCINLLLDRDDEESIECLCKFIATVGKMLDTKKKGSLDQYFTKLTQIATDKYPKLKVSSRIKFAIKDIIDLKKSKWVARFKEVGPQKMDAIVKAAIAEHAAIEVKILSFLKAPLGRQENLYHFSKTLLVKFIKRSKSHKFSNFGF